jgi:hypothetical protein
MVKDAIIKEAKPFFLANGFLYQKEDDCFINEYCSVQVQETCFAVCNNGGDVWYSNDHTIYSVVGYLTWNGLMTKNYNLP